MCCTTSCSCLSRRYPRCVDSSRSPSGEGPANVREEPAIDEYRSCRRVPNEEATPFVAVQKPWAGRKRGERRVRVAAHVGCTRRDRNTGREDQTRSNEGAEVGGTRR